MTFIDAIYYNSNGGIRMNKNELIEKIATQTKLSKKQAGEAVDSFIAEVSAALKKKDKVTLVGFGTFKVADRAARTGVNPKTGEKIKIKATRVPKFVAGKALKNRIK